MKTGGKAIALAAVSAALCVVFLTVGAYFETFELSALFTASLVLMLPLAKSGVKTSFLTYGAAVVLSLITVGGRFSVVILFAVFFGLHPILNFVLLSKGKKDINIFTPLKILWFIGVCFLMYFVLKTFTAENETLEKYIVPIIIFGGAVFGFLYDVIMIRFQKITFAIINKLKL